jgi:hypothetical protein
LLHLLHLSVDPLAQGAIIEVGLFFALFYRCPKM